MTLLQLPRIAPLALALLASSPWARPDDADVPGADLKVHSLQAAFLRCEREAATRLLGLDDAARCSISYERLLKVGFGGDFERLLAWWRAERVAEAQRERAAAR